MTIWMRDGFDTYNSLPLKWTGSTNSAAFVTSSPAPRTGAQCLLPPSANMTKQCATAQRSATFGVCLAIYKLGSNSDLRVAFMSDAAVTTHVNFRTLADGSLAVYQGSAATILLAQSALGILPVAGWFQLELKVTLGDGAAGSVEARLNGATTPILSNTACDTKNAGTLTVFDSIGILRNTGNSNVWIDDVVFWSASAAPNTNWLGDVAVETLLPSAAGATTGLTPSSGANYTCVDDPLPNTTDYVASDVVDTYDTYALADLTVAPTATIYDVLVSHYAAKSDTGARSLAPVLRSGGANYTGADVALGTGFAYVAQQYETDPATSAAWTGANVNALQVGPKVRP